MTSIQDQSIFSGRSLRRLILPLMVEQLLAATIGIADTVMVASCGEAAVSGIALVDAINILLIQVFSALATGGAVVASQYIGRGELEHACQSAKQLLYSITLLATVILTLSLVFRNAILAAVFGPIEPAVMGNAQIYFGLSALSYPFLAIYNGGAALFRSMGNSKVSMFTSLLMNIINISGNAILIFGFGWGVAGAAAASLVARVIAAVVMTSLVCRKGMPIHVDRLFRPEWHPAMVKGILRIGVPNGLENGMFQIGKLLVQGLIATFGTSVIAANAIANNICSFANIPGNAIGLALITVVGQCVGARDYGQAIRHTKQLTKVTYLCNGLLNVLMLLLLRPLVGAFGLSAEATSSAYTVILIFAFSSILIWPLSFVLPNALRASGDSKFTMLVSMLSMWIFRIGFSYWFALSLNLGLSGVWLAMVVDWMVRAVIFVLRFRGSKWKKIQLI